MDEIMFIIPSNTPEIQAFIFDQITMNLDCLGYSCTVCDSCEQISFICFGQHDYTAEPCPKCGEWQNNYVFVPPLLEQD